MSDKVCMNHTDREAESRCISCFKPICDECIIRYKGQNYCSDECAEGAEQTAQQIDEISAGQNRVRRKRIIRRILILLILCVIAFLVYQFVFKNKDMMKEIEGRIEDATGAVLTPDDFYHAKEGVWKMETKIHLLKSRKFVSSDMELKSYLVKTVKPGEIVRISKSMGRWKKLDLIKDGKVISTGWADSEDGRGEWISDILVE